MTRHQVHHPELLLREARAEHAQADHAVHNLLGLGYWNIYFIAKFVLYWQGYMGLHGLQNLAFAGFLILPVKNRGLRLLKHLLAVPIGLALFYYDSWLPPLHRLISEATLLRRFDLVYIMELIGRFIDLDMLAVLIILLVAYRFIGRYLRIGVVVLAYLLFSSVPWDQFRGSKESMPRAALVDMAEATGRQQPPEEIGPAAYLKNFFASERERVLTFRPPPSKAVPFDVLVLHVCSLSWDDLRHAEREHDLPLFDVLMTNFNAAASYSGPAAIRVLRAACGQSDHESLYDAADPRCLLFRQLKQLGFKNELAMNHDGHFDKFLEIIQHQGGLNALPLSTEGLSIPLRSFDGSPVFSDTDVLDRWLAQRKQDPAQRVAMLYNTVTLHDGNRYLDERSNLPTSKTFVPRLDGLLRDMKDFFDRLEASGRRMLVIMLPEHGAAIRGDKMQIQGLREIPSPAIVKVPVGLRLIGPGIEHPLNPLKIARPTSFLAVSDLISKLIAADPFGEAGVDLKRLIADVPETSFVAENANTVVIEQGGQYLVRLDGSSEWADYPAELR